MSASAHTRHVLWLVAFLFSAHHEQYKSFSAVKRIWALFRIPPNRATADKNAIVSILCKAVAINASKGQDSRSSPLCNANMSMMISMSTIKKPKKKNVVKLNVKNWDCSDIHEIYPHAGNFKAAIHKNIWNAIESWDDFVTAQKAYANPCTGATA